LANIELNIVALGDFSSVNAQIKALQAQVTSLNSSLGAGALSPQLASSLKSITNDFSHALVQSNAFTKQTVQLTNETHKFGTALEKGKLSVGQYFQIITGRSGAATNSVKLLALEQTKLQNSVVMSDPSKRGFYSVFTPKTIDAVSNATKIAANEQNIYNIAVNKGSQALINWGKNTQWAGRQLTVGMSVPIILFGSTASRIFNDVNEQLVRLQKVYGTGLTQPTQIVLDSIKKDVIGLSRELASSMGIAAKDTAQMAADLAATGKTGNDLLEATRQAMRLQKLGEMDTQTAMQTTISLQNVYKLNTNQLADAVNFLNAVENQTSTSLQDLAAGIPKVGPVVQQLGGSFKDTAVMMVAMKEAGVPAAQSANAIKSAIASLINPSKGAQSAFAAFHINLKDIATSTGGNPVKMIMQLQSALKGLAPLAQAQLIEKLFGKFQEARIQALITNLGSANSQTKTAFDLMNANNTQLASIAAGEMKTANESTTGKYKRSLETFKADLIPVGEMIMKITTNILNFANHVASAFKGLPGPVKLVLGVLVGFVALSGPIIMLTGLLANFAGNILKGVFNLKELVTGGKTLGQLLTPELIAAQNASDLFSTGVMGDADAIKLLNDQIVILTNSLRGLTGTMATGAGLPQITGSLAAEVGAMGTSVAEQLNLPANAKIRRSGEVGIQSVGSNAQSAAILGLETDKPGSKFLTGENASYRGTFTAATPSKTFNSKLTGGTADPQEWLDFANKEGGRGSRMNSGLYQFLNLHSTDVSTEERQAILDHSHKIITEHFSQLAKDGKTISDQEFSKIISNANDTALADLLNRNSVVKESYLNETSAIGSAATPGKRRKNGKISGISISSIKDRFSAMQDYRKTGIQERAEFGDEAVQSHIVTPNLLRRVLGVNSPNVNVYGAQGVIAKSEIDALEGQVAKAKASGAAITSAAATGIEENLPKVKAASKGITTAMASAITENSATVINATDKVTEKAASSMATKIKSAMGNKLGRAGGLGLAMMLPMVSGMLPKSIGGVDISGATSAVSTGASAGMMAQFSGIAKLQNFAGPIAIATTAVTLFAEGIRYANAQFKLSSDAIHSSFTVSSAAAEVFGLNFKPLSVYDFSKVTDNLDSHKKSVAENKTAIDALTKAYMESTNEFDKAGIEKLKKGNTEQRVAMAQAKYSSDIANGATKQQALQDVTAYLRSAGLDPQTIKIISNKAVGKGSPLGQVATAAANVDLSNVSNEIAGAYTPSKDKAVAYTLSQMAQGDVKNIDENFTKLHTNRKDTEAVNSTKVYDALTDTMSADKGFKKLAAALEKNGGDTETLTKSIAMINSTAMDPKKVADAMLKGAAAVQKLWTESLPAIVKNQTAEAAGAKEAGDKANGLGGSSPTPFTGTPEEKALEKTLQGHLTAQNAQLKIARDQLNTQNKIAQEAKRQLQYQQQISGLQNDMKTAMISGNYLQAATLRQQISGAKVDFNATTVQSRMQDQVDKLQSNADQINEALANLKDAIGNGVTKISSVIAAAKNIPILSASSVTAAGSNNNGMTVEVNITSTGEVTSTSATSSHPAVKPSVKHKKVNPQNHKIDAARKG